MAFDHATACPWCRYVCTMATSVPRDDNDNTAPENGDFSLCLKCGEWSIFDSHWVGGLRKPRPAEFVEINDDPDCRRARAAWVMINRGGISELEAKRQSH